MTPSWLAIRQHHNLLKSLNSLWAGLLGIFAFVLWPRVDAWLDAGTHHETLRRQVFGAVAKAGTDIRAVIRRNLDAVGRTGDTALTAFTDGCPGLRRILADAGVTTPPMLDWFHVAMRLQHLKQIAGALLTDDPARGTAKAVIVEEVGRLHWRIWNGKAKDAQISIDRIRAVMHHFRGEPD